MHFVQEQTTNFWAELNKVIQVSKVIPELHLYF